MLGKINPYKLATYQNLYAAEKPVDKSNIFKDVLRTAFTKQKEDIISEYYTEIIPDIIGKVAKIGSSLTEIANSDTYVAIRSDLPGYQDADNYKTAEYFSTVYQDDSIYRIYKLPGMKPFEKLKQKETGSKPSWDTVADDSLVPAYEKYVKPYYASKKDATSNDIILGIIADADKKGLSSQLAQLANLSDLGDDVLSFEDKIYIIPGRKITKDFDIDIYKTMNDISKYAMDARAQYKRKVVDLYPKFGDITNKVLFNEKNIRREGRSKTSQAVIKRELFPQSNKSFGFDYNVPLNTDKREDPQFDTDKYLKYVEDNIGGISTTEKLSKMDDVDNGFGSIF